MFDLNQLRCFVAVAEELHFGHAAERLNMTQPPLSRQIQLLEQGLDVKLLDRTSRSVQLTPVGRAFLSEARRVLRLAEGAAMTAKRIARGEAGSITIASSGASSYGFLPRLVTLATAEMHDVDLVLLEMVTTAQVEALAANRTRSRARAHADRSSRPWHYLRTARTAHGCSAEKPPFGRRKAAHGQRS